MDLLREVSDASRRQILDYLRKSPRCVGDLVELTGLKQPNVSNHLSKLRDRGIVTSTKVGRQVYYSISSPKLTEAIGSLLTPETLDESSPIELNEDLVVEFARLGTMGDETGCTAIVDRLLAAHVPVVKIYSDLFAASLSLVGQWWMVKAVNESQEHLCSAIVERLMARVINHVGPDPKPHLKAICGCSDGNWHSIVLRMVSDMLRLHGWRTLFLGGSVPTTAFVTSVREHQPAVVMVSCLFSDNAETCLDLLTQLRELKKEGLEFRIGVGGSPVNEDPHRFLQAGADFTASDLNVLYKEVIPCLTKHPRKVSGIYQGS